MASQCEVCNQSSDISHQGRTLDDLANGKQTLRQRLVKVVGQTPNTGAEGWMCSCCQFHLTQIEIYYSAVRIFKECYWASVQTRKVQIDITDNGALQRNLLISDPSQVATELDNFLVDSGLDVINSEELMPAVQSQAERISAVTVKDKNWLFSKEFNCEITKVEPVTSESTWKNNSTEPESEDTESDLGKSFCNDSGEEGTELDILEFKEFQTNVPEETDLIQHVDKKDKEKNELSEMKVEKHGIFPESSAASGCSHEINLFISSDSNVETKTIHPGDISMVCPTCDQKFLTRRELTSHMITHGQKPHTCRLCGIVFASYLALKTHKAACKGCRFICSTCGQELQSLATLHCHMLIHTGKPHVCDTCGQRFQQKSGLREHIKSHTGERPFKCDSCHKCFYTKILLKSHMVNIHSSLSSLDGGAPHVCEVCGKTFKRHPALLTHRKEHKSYMVDSDDDFKCEICDKSFGKRQGLLMHIKVHKNDTMTCVVCAETLPSQFALKSHMATHTGERPFTCRKCNKAYRQKQGLMDHMSCHHPEECDQKFTCKDCGKSFANLCRMKTHALIHRKDRPFLCNMCGNSFKLQKTLDTHMIVHTDERPWKCTECPSSFKNKPQLTLHIQRHFGNYSYPCRHCEMKFYTSTERKRHEMKHTGNYAHNCVVCSKPFREATSLKAHMHQHTGARPYQCPICGEGFANWTSHKRHMISAHGTQTDTETSQQEDQVATVQQNQSAYLQPANVPCELAPLQLSVWDSKHEMQQ